jgi:hypothetical protein
MDNPCLRPASLLDFIGEASWRVNWLQREHLERLFEAEWRKRGYIKAPSP